MPLLPIARKVVQRHQLEHCHAEAEEISFGEVRRVLAETVQDLPSHILSVPLADLLAEGEASTAAQPKISELVPSRESLKNVFGFDVQMHNVVLVYLIQGPHHIL